MPCRARKAKRFRLSLQQQPHPGPLRSTTKTELLASAEHPHTEFESRERERSSGQSLQWNYNGAEEVRSTHRVAEKKSRSNVQQRHITKTISWTGRNKAAAHRDPERDRKNSHTQYGADKVPSSRWMVCSA